MLWTGTAISEVLWFWLIAVLAFLSGYILCALIRSDDE